MASSDPHRNPPTQPPGIEGEGQEAYPTYRDGPTTTHRVTASKPTDVGLPRSRRTYAIPMLIGLIVFAVVLLARVLWGGIEMSETQDDVMETGGPAIPATTGEAPTEGPDPAAADAETGPGEVEATPGAIDVPGGEMTEPATPEPAQ